MDTADTPPPYRFTIPHKPRAKPRPRFSKRGRAYTPKAGHDYEALVASYYNGPKYEGPVSMSITFTTKGTNVYIKAIDVPVSALRADCDNLSKSVMDSLSGIAYDDDIQVQHLKATKR